MDFLIPVCFPRPNCTEVNAIYIYFNKQKPICSLLSRSTTCRSSTGTPPAFPPCFLPSSFSLSFIYSFVEMCSADNAFHLGVFGATPPDPYFQQVNITLGDHFYFDDSIGRPLTLRVGDFNLDGYPLTASPPATLFILLAIYDYVHIPRFAHTNH